MDPTNNSLLDSDDYLADEDLSTIFNYFNENGTENQLTFNGNVEMAKAYSDETFDFPYLPTKMNSLNHK